MDDEIRQALLLGPDAATGQATIDITTIGRRSGEPRRIETVFRRVGEDVYLSGIPATTPRAWLLNLEAHPKFTFHLKHGVTADLPATAEVITDPDERRRIMAPMVEELDRNYTADSPYPKSPLKEWVANSPLARVRFDETDGDPGRTRVG